jgi:hypothetical protein
MSLISSRVSFHSLILQYKEELIYCSSPLEQTSVFPGVRAACCIFRPERTPKADLIGSKQRCARMINRLDLYYFKIY